MVLRILQMWFSGSHSDVGGGFQDHDLSDLALIWMIVSVVPSIQAHSYRRF